MHEFRQIHKHLDQDSASRPGQRNFCCQNDSWQNNSLLELSPTWCTQKNIIKLQRVLIILSCIVQQGRPLQATSLAPRLVPQLHQNSLITYKGIAYQQPPSLGGSHIHSSARASTLPYAKSLGDHTYLYDASRLWNALRARKCTAGPTLASAKP